MLACQVRKIRERVGLRVGRVLDRFKMGKHLRIEITDTSFGYMLADRATCSTSSIPAPILARTTPW